MSEIKFEDVKVGDRVRLVHKNGDEATVTKAIGDKEVIISISGNVFNNNNGWHVVEILPKPVILPTGENAMVAHRTSRSWNPFVLLSSQWYELTSGHLGMIEKSEDQVRAWIRDEGFEVVFEGVQGDE